MGPCSSRIVIDYGLWWNGWNHWTKVRMSGALMTGIAVFEHILVCHRESRAVLVFDCLFQLCEYACVCRVEDALEIYDFSFRSLRGWINAKQPPNPSACFVEVEHG